jgi:L-aspartate oxidase
MQYVQFHPTTLCIPNERRFLLTEALRGEGAILRDRNGRAFAKDYHPDGELAPRDVVARTILAEMEKQGESCMYLDISHEDAKWIKERFPTIYQHCLARGIDMTKEPMPVVPAAHYHCGGVEVDLNGCTSVPGLYAAGEVSCTGVHGANRLASTSLLEGLVWGCSSADHFLENFRTLEPSPENTDPFAGINGFRDASVNEMDEVLFATQRIMWESVGPKRTKAGMASAVEKLTLLETKADKLYRESYVTRQSAGLRNAVRAAKEIALAALNSPVSVGTHYIIQDP